MLLFAVRNLNIPGMTDSNHHSSINEKQLFNDFQHGSQEIFDYFFEKYYAGLCVYAYRILKSNTEAEDLVQDFFVRLLENRKNVRIESSIKSYFIRSIHNRCLDYIAHQKVVSTHESYRLRIMTEEDFQDYPLLDNELRQQIDRAISNLPDGIRETFILNRFEGLSYQEIASRENLSVKTIEYRISKALAQLRKDLGEYLPLLLLFVK
jgi:RNA polymerase sigma-70 factor (ECF subfamily)